MEEKKENNLTIRNDTVYHKCGAMLFKITPETVIVNSPT